MAFYNIKKIEQEMNRLNIPKQYRNIPIGELFAANYAIFVSIRENAGKTTNWRNMRVFVRRNDRIYPIG